jgi:RNA-directed DNA polymerase
LFHEVCSVANIYKAWRKFRKGKTKKLDIQNFELNLEENIFAIHRVLLSKTYKPKPYESFFVKDPKLRNIHKAQVFDRVVHQALFQVLYPIVEIKLSSSVYSAREQKGTHKAVKKLYQSLQKETQNWKKEVWVLKCDIRKFFDFIEHQKLLEKIYKYNFDKDTMWLIGLLINSFEKTQGKGLPLGNVTSQLFANIYLNDFDWFVKQGLGIKYYFRYCDDFVIILPEKESAQKFLLFIEKELKNIDLELHPQKLSIRKVRQGIDFLGYVILPHAVVLRTNTKKRIYKKVKEGGCLESINSYIGVSVHAKGKKLTAYLLGEKALKETLPK